MEITEMTDAEITRETQMLIGCALDTAKKTARTMAVVLERQPLRHWRTIYTLEAATRRGCLIEATCYPDGHVETDCEWPPASGDPSAATVADSMLTPDANH
jgi:hypothetical protein